MTTTSENENLTGTEFTPFNDTDEPRVQEFVRLFNKSSKGIDTSDIDEFRQGVSIKTSNQLNQSTQPKIWAGNLNHFAEFNTFGQAVTFTEHENDKRFEDLPRFNPVWYLKDDNYPHPIIDNEGPQEENEAIIEPLNIRQEPQKDLFSLNGVRGSLQDGNMDNESEEGSNMVVQVIDSRISDDEFFFLDEGEERFGKGSVDEQIIIENYIPSIERTMFPFQDNFDKKFEATLSSINTEDKNIKELIFANDTSHLDNDIREVYNQVSSTAGYDVYGSEQALNGTDSVAYIGLTLGS